MSDLRVTDVQSALRHFKTFGHDILTDPRAVHLTNHPDEKPKPYRMAAGHSLILSSEGHAEYLNSYLMQSERPLISLVGTHQYRRGTDGIAEVHHGRHVFAYVPTMGTPHNARGLTSPEHHHFNADIINNLGGSGSGNHSSGTGWSSAISPIFNNHQKDIHDALQEHMTKAVSHTGIRYMAADNKQQLMTPEEMTNFSVPHALFNLLDGAQPFKGLVTVRQFIKDGMSTYHYNPDTEELNRHE